MLLVIVPQERQVEVAERIKNVTKMKMLINRDIETAGKVQIGFIDGSKRIGNATVLSHRREEECSCMYVCMYVCI